MALTIINDPQNIFFRCVEDCSEAIMITDKDRKLVYVNPAWQQIYGFDSSEALGQSPRILRSEGQDQNFYQRMWVDILNPDKGSWRGELINITKEGIKVPVLLTITPFREKCGKISGFMGIAVDIREKKKLEQQVIHQDRLASIGTLASGLAHEIGTPLGTIRGRAELMSMTPQLGSSLKSGLKIIISQIDRVSKLIDSLLRISRKKAVVELSSVALQPLLNDISDLLVQKLTNAGVRLEIECSKDIRILAERSRVEQVLLNLSMNSIHAIIEKQSLIPKDGSNFLRFSAHEAEGSVFLKIEDSGCGIADKHISDLFKPFFTTKEAGEGTGLGLAIVARILDELKAQISVESKIGKGTSFFIQFKDSNPH